MESHPLSKTPIRRCTVAILTAAAIGNPSSGHAEPELAQIERLSKTFAQRIGAALAAQTPGGKTIPPRLTWTPALEDAATCTLTKYRQRIGRKRVSDLLDKAERILSRPGLSLDDATDEGERLRPLTRKEMTEIDRTCGFTLAGLQSLMTDPNFPKIMARAMKLFQPMR